jgi:putative FmdB family regulatory protein
MPIYEYKSQLRTNCSYCAPGFDRLEKLLASPLTNCPRCGQVVQRIMSAPRINKSGPSLDPGIIEKHGFTQYKKSGQGVYEKTAGKGPRVITNDGDSEN